MGAQSGHRGRRLAEFCLSVRPLLVQESHRDCKLDRPPPVFDAPRNRLHQTGLAHLNPAVTRIDQDSIERLDTTVGRDSPSVTKLTANHMRIVAGDPVCIERVRSTNACRTATV
jgi:hypothetical protein